MGDCIRTGEDPGDHESVDCSTADARYVVLGVEADAFSESRFDSASAALVPGLCAAFPAATAVFWYGSSGGDGTVYCAADV